MNQKGFTNIFLMPLIVLLVVVAGYFAFYKPTPSPSTSNETTPTVPVPVNQVESSPISTERIDNSPVTANNSLTKLPKITLLSPIGGEVWIAGSSYNIRWAPLPDTLLKNLRGDYVYIQIWLVGEQEDNKAQVAGSILFPKNGPQEANYNFNLTSVGSGSLFSFTFGKNLLAGKYKVEVKFFDFKRGLPCGVITGDNTAIPPACQDIN